MKTFAKLPVSAVMTRDVIIVLPDTVMTEVATIFESKNIHHLPVVDKDGAVVGMISKSEYYLLLDQFSLFKREKMIESNRKFLSSLLAREVMRKDVITITPTEEIKVAANIFHENLFHALPVVEKGKLVGIITTLDLIDAAFRLRELYLD